MTWVFSRGENFPGPGCDFVENGKIIEKGYISNQANDTMQEQGTALHMDKIEELKQKLTKK